jgi:hypothetical protein
LYIRLLSCRAEEALPKDAVIQRVVIPCRYASIFVRTAWHDS